MPAHQTATRSGVQAHIRIHGVLHRQHFRRGTPPAVIRAWLLATELRYRRLSTKRTGLFDDDARAYLQAVAAMPTYAQRHLHVSEWIAVFGRLPRCLITADQIAAQLHAWRKTKAAATVNKRRTALMHLYTVLDGKALPNPVKDAPKFPEPAPAPRALPYAVIRQIFKVMPESRSKARLRVLAYTGIPPGQIATIHPTDVDWRARTVAVAGRQKGKGTRARVVPLTAHAVAAFRAMQRTNAWGPCSRTVLRRVFLRAVHRVLGPDVTLAPYVLRHSFGTEVYRRSGDIRATQILLDHSTPQLTHRYTGAAVDPRVQAAIRSWR